MKLGAEASRRGDEAYARGDMREAERQYARERKIVETHNRIRTISTTPRADRN